MKNDVDQITLSLLVACDCGRPCLDSCQTVTAELHPFVFSCDPTYPLLRSRDPLALIMKHRLSVLASLPRVTTTPRALYTPTFSRLHSHVPTQRAPALSQRRTLTATSCLMSEDSAFARSDSSHATPASELNNNITQEEKDHFAKKLQEDKGKQIRTPWHRQGSDIPPVARQRSAGAMTKGMHLCTRD